MAQSRNDPPQDNRTNLQKEIDRQKMHDDATKEWDEQQKAMMEFENNLLFGLALKGLAPKVPFISESQKAYELMRRLFEMQHQQQQIEQEKGDRNRPGSPIRSPKPEWDSGYGKAPPPPRGTTVPLSPPPASLRPLAPKSSAGDWLGLQQSDFGARLPQGIMGRGSDLAPDGRDRSSPPVANPLISMGLLQSPLDVNQTPLPTQAAPGPSSPRPAAPAPQLSSVSDVPHWLAQLASTPPSQSVSDVSPWLNPETVGKSLRRLLGSPG